MPIEDSLGIIPATSAGRATRSWVRGTICPREAWTVFSIFLPGCLPSVIADRILWHRFGVEVVADVEHVALGGWVENPVRLVGQDPLRRDALYRRAGKSRHRSRVSRASGSGSQRRSANHVCFGRSEGNSLSRRRASALRRGKSFLVLDSTSLFATLSTVVLWACLPCRAGICGAAQMLDHRIILAQVVAANLLPRQQGEPPSFRVRQS